MNDHVHVPARIYEWDLEAEVAKVGRSFCDVSIEDELPPYHAKKPVLYATCAICGTDYKIK